MSQSLSFTATGSTELLSFLAGSGPSGLPPTAPLDGVTTTAVPESATWMLIISGFGIIGVSARRRRDRGVIIA